MFTPRLHAAAQGMLTCPILTTVLHQKAERNVLPTLNNLLENREMNLPDGRFLVAPKRYNELAAGNSSSGDPAADVDLSQLVPVHPDFRVIALGVRTQ